MPSTSQMTVSRLWIGAQIARYKQGYITFDEFLRRIQYIKGITFQYAFCTQRSIDKLQKL